MLKPVVTRVRYLLELMKYLMFNEACRAGAQVGSTATYIEKEIFNILGLSIVLLGTGTECLNTGSLCLLCYVCSLQREVKKK